MAGKGDLKPMVPGAGVELKAAASVLERQTLLSAVGSLVVFIYTQGQAETWKARYTEWLSVGSRSS